MKMTKDGTDPNQIINVLKKFKLNFLEYPYMTLKQLKYFVNTHKPVFMMIQAWSESKKSYKDVWDEGHWVVAIGYDDEGVYFEDPSLLRKRGFINFDRLDEKWHDIGPINEPVDHYGLVVWERISFVKIPERIRLILLNKIFKIF